MSHADKHADKELTGTALTLVAMKLESMDQRIDRRLSTIEDGQSKLFGLMEKLLDGQAVLHQNEMEFKLRLDEIVPAKAKTE